MQNELRRTMLIAVPTIIAIGQLGCEPQRTTQSSQRQVAEDVDRNFDNAVSFLERAEEFQMNLAHEQALYFLQRWIRKQGSAADWIADPMADRIPEKYKTSSDIDELAKREFQSFDIVVMQEAVWLKNIAQLIDTNELVDASVALWADGLAQPTHHAQLVRVLKLFDWTIRNLQLEANRFIDIPEDLIGKGSEDKQIREVWYAWENLTMGRATAEERARVLMLLGRQLGIDIVALGIDENSSTRFWLAAAKIDDQLYLLDPQLGLPIPGPNESGVATLAQVMQSPDLLRQLDIEDQAYPVTASELPFVSAMVDATPAYLSQRMRLVEQQLSGEARFALTTRPSQLQKKLRDDCKIQNVRIWMLPYEGFLFRRAMIKEREAAVAELQAKMDALRAKYDGLPPEEIPPQEIPQLRELRFGTELLDERALFHNRTPLSQGRILHFAGRFENDDDRKGAIVLYMEGRPSKLQLREIASEKGKDSLKTMLGLKELPKDASMAPIVEMLARTKQYCSYWLGLIQFEMGEYESAADWFKKRTLESFESGIFRQGATYNLARCYEAIGRRDEDDEMKKQARELYQDRESLQLHGNLLRAKLLVAE